VVGPVEQLPPEHEYETVLRSIGQPPVAWLRRARAASGAATRGRPRGPDDTASPADFARQHPKWEGLRIFAGATRAGATSCALWTCSHEDDQSVVGGADLVPELLTSTLEDDV
jgi:hypothetical protein